MFVLIRLPTRNKLGQTFADPGVGSLSILSPHPNEFDITKATLCMNDYISSLGTRVTHGSYFSDCLDAMVRSLRNSIQNAVSFYFLGFVLL